MTPTKERWIVSGKYINSNQGISICMMMGSSSTDKANARLIAAAPDLLEALEECVALIRNTITTADDLHEIHNADKAIQKAKA